MRECISMHIGQAGVQMGKFLLVEYILPLSDPLFFLL